MMSGRPIVKFGNPDNPQIAMDLPESVWRSIQTVLYQERELHPVSSEEYQKWDTVMSLIKSRTGVSPAEEE